MRGGKADALDARHVMHGVQQVRERPRAPPAACTTKQNNLLRNPLNCCKSPGCTQAVGVAEHSHAPAAEPTWLSHSLLTETAGDGGGKGF